MHGTALLTRAVLVLHNTHEHKELRAAHGRQVEKRGIASTWTALPGNTVSATPSRNLAETLSQSGLWKHRADPLELLASKHCAKMKRRTERYGCRLQRSWVHKLSSCSSMCTAPGTSTHPATRRASPPHHKVAQGTWISSLLMLCSRTSRWLSLCVCGPPAPHGSSPSL